MHAYSRIQPLDSTAKIPFSQNSNSYSFAAILIMKPILVFPALLVLNLVFVFPPPLARKTPKSVF
jgi:hypothetical protein